MSKAIVSGMNRTLPSHNPDCTPPACMLRDVCRTMSKFVPSTPSQGARAAGSQAGGFGLGIGDFAFAGRDANELDDQLDALEDAGPPSTLQAILGINQQAQEDSAATFSGTEHDLDLGGSVHVLDIWVQGMPEVASAGVIYLYFFPHGYTQDAVIHLEDDDGAVFTVQTGV